MDVGALLINGGGELIWLNQFARHIFGFGLNEDIINMKIPADEIIELAAACLRSDSAISREAVVSTGSKAHTVSCCAAPLKIGWPQKAVIILLRDISEDKEIDLMKTEFISTISHELRTPLSITKEGISLVLDGITGAVNDKQRQVLSTAKDNIMRLSRIIDSMLDISRIDSGRMSLKKELIGVDSLMEKVISLFRPAIEAKGFRLKLNYSKTDTLIYIDLERIVQVFRNLVDNSLKFSREGDIGFSALTKGKDIEFVVSDSGEGVPNDNLKNIFDKFWQRGKQAGAGEKGTGLGLSIAKGIIELHGGRIRAESEEGKGMRFIFSLPSYALEDFSRSYISDKIEDAAHKKIPVSLIVVSLLKNSTDKLLDELEHLIKSNLRRIDDMALKMDDEVVIVLNGCNKEGAFSVAKRFKEVALGYLGKTALTKPDNLRLTYATFPDDATDYKRLIEKAHLEAAQKSKRRILFIEDEEDQIMMVKLRLEAAGYEVMPAGEPFAGLNKAFNENPDLILLDLIMPGIDGFEVCRKLKQDPRTANIPVIFITVADDADFKEKCLAMGGADFIKKPYNPDELLRCINAALKA